MAPSTTGLPRNAVVILLDSLNRHLIGAYGGTEFDTPNLDRIARRGVRFTRHYSGSLPCMPARHDLLCGALDFLWKPWGSIEIWERPITYYLRKAGVVTQLITDHPHLFEHGGENYHCDFYAWDYQRGHEGDPWKTIVDETLVGTPRYHRPADHPYHRNRRAFRSEEDFPGPKVMASAASWLRENARAHSRFLLFVDEFDPHEPFDTPEPYSTRYDPDWPDAKRIWPPYQLGPIDPREARQIRAQYGGKLSMIDHWLGKVLDAMDETGLWQDTLFILLSDHGHYLGEHDCWGKPPAPVYDTLGHIPMMICAPGLPAGASEALSTTVDVTETLLELFGVERTGQRRHGRSLLPLLRGETTTVREWVLQGYWGQRVNLIDADYKLARGVAERDALSIYSNRWSTMPPIQLPEPDHRATLGPHMPGSELPIIRQPLSDRQVQSLLWSVGDHERSLVFAIGEDPAESRDLAGDATLSRRLSDKLRAALDEVCAPQEQKIRLGL
jgi:arylsulfatase A-like enzyme